jgi:hypothetical protein
MLIAIHSMAYRCGSATKILPIQMAEAQIFTNPEAVRIGLIYGRSAAKNR